MDSRIAGSRGRVLAAAAVVLLAPAGCSAPEATESPADPGRLYTDPSYGTCRSLPFELLEQPVGRPYSDFGAWKNIYGSVETVFLADTFGVECRMDIAKDGDFGPPSGLLWVYLYTYPTAAEAAAYFDTRPKGDGGPTDMPASDIDVERLTWRDNSAGSGWASGLSAQVLDRNLVMSVNVRAGDKESDEPTIDTLRTAVSAFMAEGIRRLRGNPPRPVPQPVEAKAGPTYPAPAEGFCQRLPLDLFHDRLGDPLFDLPQEGESGRSCWLSTAGKGKSRGGNVTLWIRHHTSAQQALDFHQAHLSISPAPTPTVPAGTELDVDALDWSYLPPAEGRDGIHHVRLVSGNLYLYLDVTGYSDNTVPLVDSALTPTIAEFLRATLLSMRG